MVDEDKDVGEKVVDRETDQGSLRELDAEVAERVMGWRRNPNYKNVRVPIWDMAFEWYVSGYGSNDLRRYSTNIAAAMEVEDRIAELGLQKQYLQALGPTVAKAATEAGEILGYWHFTHANAEQRCRAALKAAECLSINNRGTNGQASQPE